jgi:hypothetical protein
VYCAVTPVTLGAGLGAVYRDNLVDSDRPRFSSASEQRCEVLASSPNRTRAPIASCLYIHLSVNDSLDYSDEICMGAPSLDRVWLSFELPRILSTLSPRVLTLRVRMLDFGQLIGLERPKQWEAEQRGDC